MTKALLAMLTAALVTAVPAEAITYGQPDGNGHPNVGAVIRLRSDGQYRILCSGSLISPTVFLTAAHCTRFLEDQESRTSGSRSIRRSPKARSGFTGRCIRTRSLTRRSPTRGISR
jgi:Trypsin